MTLYFNKANEEFVSESYNVDVIEEEKYAKNYTFIGRDKDTRELKYILYVYRNGIYEVHESKGVNKEQALLIAQSEGVNVINITLIVYTSFTEDRDITKHLYWLVESDNGVYLYIDFIDGVIQKK
ncbi:hypothetical protein F8154_07390 [Alkaliphilus pronyensis]|uniref:DUF5590 domain-containing protein n=1 Tax=Alkaliphilus pronyensis TaxID=1482732 RepID=A0A6I0F043_9FIRM|nr:hypothetical protein [Alkaliphilus pronyensis]KAB3535257.1 hypothetical protein F8154_07390 [Alkaliphilus pronyensis]